MTKFIDYDEAKAMLETLATEKPDYQSVRRYTRDYTFDGDVVLPECIVGHALVRWGAPIADLFFIDSEAWEDVADDPESAPRGIGHLMNAYEYPTGMGPENRATLDSLGVEFDQDALDFLSEAQAKQDAGAPWSRAVEHAIIVAETE